MLLKINPENPAGRKIQIVVDKLLEGGVIIYPHRYCLWPGLRLYSIKKQWIRSVRSEV